MDIEGDQCNWKLVGTINKHMHTYVAILQEFNQTLTYTAPAYYGKVESNCGDVGYIHSSQLDIDNGGYFSFPEKFIYEGVTLSKLAPENGCSDFSSINGEFLDRSGKLVVLPLDTYWGFYDTDENCESVINTYLYDCDVKLVYTVGRNYDEYNNTGWTYYMEVDKTIVTNDAKRTVTGTNVNIRKGPGKNYEVVGKLNLGDVFSLKEIDHEGFSVDGYYGSWVKIQFGEIEGWIFSKYIQRK